MTKALVLLNGEGGLRHEFFHHDEKKTAKGATTAAKKNLTSEEAKKGEALLLPLLASEHQHPGCAFQVMFNFQSGTGPSEVCAMLECQGVLFRMSRNVQH